MTTPLEGKYFDPAGGTVFSKDTATRPFVGGKPYLEEIWQALQKPTSIGDVIYMLGWMFDWTLDLVVPPTVLNPTGPVRLSEILLDKVVAGVDVRVVLSGALYARGLIASFQRNLDSAEALRTAIRGGVMPLADRVLFDFSGALSGSHHQKATVIKSGTDLQAFVGGIDFWPNRRDVVPYDSQKWFDGTPWGWHDTGVQLNGPAATAAWENFRQRWANAAKLPRRTFRTVPSAPRRPFNPPAPGATPPTPPLVDPAPTVPAAPAPASGDHPSVQVMRSRFDFKQPNLIFPGGVPWEPPAGAIREIFPTLRKAIDAATTYVYAEDQFLTNTLCPEFGEGPFDLFPSFQAAAANDVKVIFLSSEKSDPEDFPRGKKNQSLTNILQDMVSALGLKGRNIVVYRVKDLTVHSKTIVIDDEFAAIGSANLHTRSMFGVDDELHVAYVNDGGTAVRDLRVELWGNHLRVNRSIGTVQAALENLPLALGIWRAEWLPVGADPGTWRSSNIPPGFSPAQSVLELVGPP